MQLHLCCAASDMLGDTISVDYRYVSMCNTLSTQVLLTAFHMSAPKLPLHCQTWQLHQHPTKWLLTAYLVLTLQLHDWTDDLMFGQANTCAFKPKSA